VNIAIEYIKYLILAKGRHGTHSPFVYEFVNKCLNTNITKKFLLERKKIFKDFKKSKKHIIFEDFGVGSKRLSSSRKIKEIFKVSSSKGKYGLLLYKLNAHYKFENILELGTSIGIGSFHLHKGYGLSKITTVEGCKETYKVAEKALEGFENITLLNKTFLDFLKDSTHPVYNLVFIDGHHDGDALMNYLKLLQPYTNDDTLFILDDIRWSESMFTAWNKIIESEEYHVTIDLFRMGITMKRPKQYKEHFILKI